MDLKKNNKKILKIIWMIYALGSIVLVLYLANKLVCSDIMKVSNRVILNDNWDVTINDKVYKGVSLDNFAFDTLMKKDEVIMKTIVPDDYDFKEASICIPNRHTTVSMYVDGNLEYEYGKDRYENNKATGSGYLLVNFLEEYKGKNLRLEFTVTEDNAFSKIDEMWISEWENSYRYIITNNRLPLLMGCFLVVLGVMMTFVQIFAVVFSSKYRNVLFLSVFSICIGIWTLCYYDIMIMFSLPLYKVALMEYMTLFIAPLPIIGYMYGHVKEANSKVITCVYNVLFLVQAILTVLAIALHTTDTVHGAGMLKYFLVMFVVLLSFFAYVLFIRTKKNVMLSKFTNAGLITVLFCVFYEVASFIVSRHTKFNVPQIKGISSVGFAIFVGILVIDLYHRATMNMMEEHEKALLIKRAYTDELTKLHNRTYCSEYMRNISLDKNSKYTVIIFDLNGLKKINDTYGHLKGDELICYAAIVLEKTFASEGVVGRMGGDEFMAILETDDKSAIEKLLENFNENIKEVNEKKPELGLSISYGYATNSEVREGRSEKIYQLADERMYAYKQEVKKAMQG
ncbi:MAG: diguanylate cyclase [Lachnospiraceae bacterium]|nr:diguanylate cyclase [Lachnospiraceae bacterium]